MRPKRARARGGSGTEGMRVAVGVFGSGRRRRSWPVSTTVSSRRKSTSSSSHIARDKQIYSHDTTTRYSRGMRPDDNAEVGGKISRDLSRKGSTRPP